MRDSLRESTIEQRLRLRRNRKEPRISLVMGWVNNLFKRVKKNLHDTTHTFSSLIQSIFVLIVYLRDVPKGLEANGERLLGLVEQTLSHGIVSRIYDFLLYANQASVEVAFSYFFA